MLHRMRHLRTPLTFSLLVMKSPYRTLRQQDLMPALRPPTLLSMKVCSFLCRCTRLVTHEGHLEAGCVSLFCMPSHCCAPLWLLEDLHVPEAAPVPGSAAEPEPAFPSVHKNMRAPAHADMPQRTRAEQQAPAPLQGPTIKPSRRVTRDRRVPTGQASTDTGRGIKRRAAHCDETADAPQSKRQRSEPNEPNSQQASEEAPTPGDSAVPAPAAAEAPAAASYLSPDSMVHS